MVSMVNLRMEMMVHFTKKNYRSSLLWDQVNNCDFGSHELEAY